MTAFTTLIQHITRGTSHSNQTRTRNKRHPNWKGRSKTAVICWCHDIVYTKNSNKKLQELINEFSKIAGYKINIQIQFISIHHTKLSERETKKTILFTITSKNKIPRNKLNQGCTEPVLVKLQDTKERN